MGTTRLEDRLNRWEVLNANLKNHLEEMPDMQPKQAEFEQIIEQDLTLAAQYNQLNATSRAILRQRRELAKKGNQLRNVFTAALRHRFGPESQQLNEFGVKPRVFRRKKKEEPKPELPASPAAPGITPHQPAA
jgi:hypothetical protein